jgi:hypothetical protein
MQQQTPESSEGNANGGGSKYVRIGVVVLGGLFIVFMIIIGMYRRFGG